MRQCAINGCDRKRYCRGWCAVHYSRWQRHGNPETVLIGQIAGCSVDGCEGNHKARGFCALHYGRWLKHGDTARPAVPRRYEDDECAVTGCHGRRCGRGLCGKHYWRRATHDSFELPEREPRRWLSRQGYIMVADSSHPNANSRGAVFEHRLVMAGAIGRPLRSDETVHHRNGDRTDNRLANLELWSHSHPDGQRVEDKVAWALELLRLYRPNLLAECGEVTQLR